MREGGDDLVCAEEESCFPHGVGVDYPCEAVPVCPS